MNLERYEYHRLDEFSYRFLSEGPRGTFTLHVRFERIRADTYNLGFGVIDQESAWLDDLIEVRNGDSQKILATVSNIALEFLENHPSDRIFATGSTKSRTRLYQMGINRILPSLKGYTIAGYVARRSYLPSIGAIFSDRPEEWHTFEKSVLYDAFLIYKS